MVARSATRDLGRQLIQQLGVSLRIDLAFQQARRALDRELSYFLAQLFTRPRTLPRHFVPCLICEALGFVRRRALGFVDDFVRTLARQIDDLSGWVACFAVDFPGARLV